MAHQSMRGKDVDMEKLMRQHELAPAVGNAKFNARGDKLGPNGQIIERREDMMSNYYETSTKAQLPTQAAPVPEKVEPQVNKIKKGEE